MNYNEIMVAQARNQVLRKLGVDMETKRTVVFPEATVTYNSELNCYTPPAFELVGGKTYTVTINGVAYVTESADVKGDLEAVIVGNKAFFNEGLGLDFKNTGESWVIIYSPSVEFTQLRFFELVYDENGNFGGFESADMVAPVTLSIYEVTETIHPIDPKFLPGVCLPVVEITSAPFPSTGGTVALSAQEVAQFVAAAEKQLPVVVKMELSPQQPGAMVCLCAMASAEEWCYVTTMGELSFWFNGDRNNGTMGEG